jgi:predicted regulator of Ras-like GTPase activity (Roadblock/LC7/MglB family)
VVDDIRTLTARVAEEPSSLAFLELGETLRRRGQLEAASKVVRGGLARYPGLADAHDLLARILGDQDDLAGAFDAWTDALRFDPMRVGALKGIAFLYFRAGDVVAALEHLRRAADIDPDDDSIRQAIDRVRQPPPARAASPTLERVAPPAESAAAETASAPDPVPAGHEGPGSMLVDGKGLRLRGTLRSPANEEVGDRVAAELAGVSKEAARTSKLLGLGSWQAIAVESPEGNLYMVAPTPNTILLTIRDSSLPMGQLGLLAERAAREARQWLEQHG